MKRALVPVADGTTESEAVVLAEVLRRAGVEVVIAASSLVAGGFGLRLLPDAVCSAPNLLRRWGYVGEAQRFTAHPASLGFATGGRAQPDSIVREPLLITGISATATLPWALAVVEQLWGAALRQEVEQKMGPAA